MSSQPCFSKPAPWVVAKRIKQREAGFAMVRLERFVREHLEETGFYPSYEEVVVALDFHNRGHVSNVAKRAEKYGLLRREGSGRNRRLRLA